MCSIAECYTKLCSSLDRDLMTELLSTAQINVVGSLRSTQHIV